MKRYERFISILLLIIISLSNVATPVVYAAPMVKIHFSLPKEKDLYAGSADQASKILHENRGSVLSASTSILTVGTQELDIRQNTVASAHQRIPIRMQALEKKVYRTDEDVTFAVTNPDNEAFTTSVMDADGKNANVAVTESNDGTTTRVNLTPSNAIRPGKYKIMITDANQKTTEQDFTWGVLALNIDKSIYHPNETADIAMAVLNDKGDMVCDAQVLLTITKPDGTTDELSTNNNKVTISQQCQKHEYSLQPDYEAHYQFKGEGVYNFQLKAITTNGTHTISDTIQVKDQIDFDLQRVSATRIYPPNTYPMIFNVTANRDFTGTVTETVPESFTITPATQSASQSYTSMQTMYLSSTDPTAQLQQALLSTGQSRLVMPFHGDFPITQGFGAQLTDPDLQTFYANFGLGGHDGIDFGVPMGTPLYAVDEGDIVWSGPGDYGITIIIQHSWGKSYYGHLSNTSVTIGQHVVKGQEIGSSGNTGDGTGPHLHFGMKPNNPDIHNGYYGKIDPMPYLPLGHQALSVATLGSLVSLAHTTEVLGASDSATASPSAEPVSNTPTPSLPSNPSNPSVSTASPSATPTATPAPAPTVDTAFTSSSAANENFTVLSKEIKLNEEIANKAQTQKVKIITWQVSLKKGKSTTLGYMYQTPKDSPEFYLLGPVKFYESSLSKAIFEEKRQWQIAADDVGIEWFQDTTGPKWNGYSWQYRKKITIDHTKVSQQPSVPTVTFMESGTDATKDFSLYQSTSTAGASTITSDCTISHDGPCSIKATNDNTNKAYAQTPTISNTTSGRISGYFYFDSMPSGTNILPFMALISNATLIESLGVDGGSSDKLKFNGVAGAVGTTVLTTGTWYRISIAYTITSTTVNEFKVYLNGSKEIDLVNDTIPAATVDRYRVGNLDNNDVSTTDHVDDVYADNGTDLSDPGDIRVTAKRPNANGAANNFTTQIGSGGSGYGTGHSPQVNERPLSNLNGWSINVANTRENYTVEGTATGDVDLSNAALLADEAWVDAKTSSACTGQITNNGTDTAISLTTTETVFTNITTSSTFPSGTQAVGIQSCTGTQTVSLYEAGVQIAYIPNVALTNFPVLINLASDSSLSAKAQANGNDIVFTDSTGRTKLNHEIENYASGTLQAWVKIPSLSATADTVIYMYYGNPAASSQQNATAVWSAYNSVWHLDEATSATTISDSTATNNGTKPNVNLPTQSTNGIVFDSQSYAGASTNTINVTTSASLNFGTSSFSFSCWVNTSTHTGTADTPLYKGGASATDTGYDIEKSTGASAWKGHLVDGTTSLAVTLSSSLLEDSTWHYLTVVSDRGNGILIPYLDGAEKTTSALGSLGSSTNTKDLNLGRANASFPYTGLLDECRIAPSALSSEWLLTDYNNENSPGTFYTVNGTVETNAYAPTLDKLMRHGTWFDSTGTKQPFTF